MHKLIFYPLLLTYICVLSSFVSLFTFSHPFLSGRRRVAFRCSGAPCQKMTVLWCSSVVVPTCRTATRLTSKNSTTPPAATRYLRSLNVFQTEIKAGSVSSLLYSCLLSQYLHHPLSVEPTHPATSVFKDHVTLESLVSLLQPEESNCPTISNGVFPGACSWSITSYIYINNIVLLNQHFN